LNWKITEINKKANAQQLSVAIVDFSGINVSQSYFCKAENTQVTNFHNSHRQQNVISHFKDDQQNDKK